MSLFSMIHQLYSVPWHKSASFSSGFILWEKGKNLDEKLHLIQDSSIKSRISCERRLLKSDT